VYAAQRQLPVQPEPPAVSDAARRRSLPHVGPPAPGLRVAVHDRSRVEWVATVPIAPPGVEHTWEIAFEAQIPDAMWLPHAPWSHFTVRSRLMSPVLTAGSRQQGAPIEQVRRRALAASHAIKLATAALSGDLRRLRHRDRVIDDAAAAALEDALAEVGRDAQVARGGIEALRDPSDRALSLEADLADEFISNQLLMFVTRLVGGLGPRRGKGGRIDPALSGEVDRVHAALRRLLEGEDAHRRARGIRHSDLREQRGVEAFIGHGAQLKKHFQQALFLDARAYMVDERLHNWIAALTAMAAFVVMFAGQIWILNSVNTTTTTLSILIAGTIGALVYALKDRIKEVGREWLARRVKHTYADRVAHLRLQARMDAHQTPFALARETISVRRLWQDDPLNPALGATSLVHVLSIKERLRHEGLSVLHDQGLVGLKHVFRYDLSPLLVKLDDQRKRVPVLGPHRVHLRAATRVYSVPVQVSLTRAGTGERLSQRGVLRFRRDGLERFAAAGPVERDVVGPAEGGDDG